MDYQITPEIASKIFTARFAVKLSRIFTVVTLAVAVISTVLTIIDLCRDKSVEQLPIPKYLVDNYTDVEGGSYSLNYKAVECNREEYFSADYTRQKGSCADLILFLVAVSIPMVYATEQPTIAVAYAEGKPGDTISVPIVIENNPGIIAIRINASRGFIIRCNL